jgi:hypothetical protein
MALLTLPLHQRPALQAQSRNPSGDMPLLQAFKASSGFGRAGALHLQYLDAGSWLRMPAVLQQHN